MSRLTLITVLSFVLLLSSFGCVGKTGIVRIKTDPPGATYYVDGVEKGRTPAEFEWDANWPCMLEIKKDGYHTEQELLNKYWVWYQESMGNYRTIRVGKGGKKWTVVINLKLKAAPTKRAGEGDVQ
jgi:hypothetical protein